MARLIPSTTALITFEAAARLGAFSKAADELCLTESAVSKQMNKLEAYLGVDLFERAHGRITLTQAGEGYAAEVRRALDKIEATTQAVVNFHQGRKELRIAALPTFSNKWLLPRLKSFSELHPDVIVNISGRMEPFPFHEAEFDAAVHFEDPTWQNVRKFELFSEELIAVVSPKHFDPQSWLDDVESIPLLKKATREDAWRRWFETAGITHPAPTSGPYYDSFATLIEAVRSGMGISLVPRLYVTQELKSGDLVQPCPHTLKAEKTYTIIAPDRDGYSPSLQKFIEWLRAEARSFQITRDTVEPVSIEVDSMAADNSDTLPPPAPAAQSRESRDASPPPAFRRGSL